MQVRRTAPMGEKSVTEITRKFATARCSHEIKQTKNANRTKSIPKLNTAPKIKRIKSEAVIVLSFAPERIALTGELQKKYRMNITKIAFIQKRARSPRFVLSCIKPPQ